MNSLESKYIEDIKTFESDKMEQLIMQSLDKFPPLLDVKDVATILRMGENAAYEVLNSGVMPTMKVGRKSVIPKPYMGKYIFESTCITE
ncbi:helix-turn-helix domain-containing protein [Paenibacillus taichungensis]|uniref:helix-turn-helix domain-containing protein n=1 Tax=Paenibacillus taichungensis TaxID=484184 RepID=UPI00399EEBE2